MKELEQSFFKEPEKQKSVTEVARKIFDIFLRRSDEPGEFISGEEMDKLIKESRNNPESLKKFKEDKKSKYRINSLFSPIEIAGIFLESEEAKKIPSEEKEELLQKVKKAEENIMEAKTGKITKKEVGEVVEIIKKLEKYLY